MLEIEVIGIECVLPHGGPSSVEVEELCALALSSAGISEGHASLQLSVMSAFRQSLLLCEGFEAVLQSGGEGSRTLSSRCSMQVLSEGSNGAPSFLPSARGREHRGSAELGIRDAN